jgi:HTH-type transcriptional regulator, sugar sensing transcriptional regulator
MEAKELISTGLTKNQAEVYLEILKHPEQSGGEIAKAISIDRSFVYSIVNSLIDKGLVSYITKGKVRLYYSADPENLLKDIEEKRNNVNKIVQELKSMKEQTKSEKSVLVYEGKAGLKAYIRDFLDAKSFETLGGGGNLKILEALKYEYPHYLKDLNKKKIKGKLITSPKNKKIMEEIYKNSKVDIKTFEGLKSGVSFTIFNNKLAIYSAEEKPFVIIIENGNIASALKDYFNKTWNFAK